MRRVRFQVLVALLLIAAGALWLLEALGILTHDVAGHLLPLPLIVIGAYYLAVAPRAHSADSPFFWYGQRGHRGLGTLLFAGGLLWLAASFGWLREGVIVPLLVVALGFWILLRQVRLKR